MNLADKNKIAGAPALPEKHDGPGLKGASPVAIPFSRGRFDQYFSLSKLGSSIGVEMLAGVSTFLALSYIFVVNPAILHQAGMNPSAVFFATVVVSGVATIVMGLWANLPFALAPGMEMNAYVAFFVVGAMGFSWQQALGAVFWSGILFIMITVLKVRAKIIDAIPKQMKSSLSLCVGVFLVLVALKVAGVAHFNGVHLSGIGHLASSGAQALAISLLLILFLEKLHVPGSVLISIVATSLFWHWRGFETDAPNPIAISRSMFSAIGQFQPSVILVPRALSAILVLFLVDFFGSVAKLIGLSANTSIAHHGIVPGMHKALLVDSVGSTAAALTGTSSITVYVESGIGIAAGGRTGLTSVVCGVLMIATLGLAPILSLIPTPATTGALVFVAIKLLPSMATLRQCSKVDLVAFVLMPATVVVTFAIDRAVLVGFLCYLIPDALHRRWNPYLIGSAVLLLVGVILQSV